MTEPNTNLMAKYLAGDATADEVQQLEALLQDDAQANALLAEAYTDVHLREALNGANLGAAVAPDAQQTDPVVARVRPKRWVGAALWFAAVAGWVVAAYVGGKLNEARTNISTLTGRVAALEQAIDNQTNTGTDSDAPQIHSTRGWLMALPHDGGMDGQTLYVGAPAPLDQRLWTCPWGAAEFRYDSGASISIERNTVFTLNETDDLRQLKLDRGIVHVTNLDDEQRPTEIKTELATVRLVKGQVAVQVGKNGTAVETAINEVEVDVIEDGVTRTFTVRRQEYLIVKPGEKATLHEGMLKLGLEPPE